MSELMRGAGFRDADSGPFVTELRHAMERKQAAGLKYMSPGTWADGPFWEVGAEQRAQALLAMEWSFERGHTYRVECLEPPIRWQYDARTLRRSLHVDWRSIPSWLGDRWREAGMRYRMWRDRKLVNPYAAIRKGEA